ncbi:2'-5' RNA ligase family protein [Planosporangium thailandense]|uniref:2'-5' RNA ligase family protein n=1 Tax=Planosporangium thailandense TaxID=765197 RepID=A0ABX0Y214_9ACTN|nr:2'-5' RNA ligase family protein [Planosporangium thailandense]NJC72391.1 2'-5' RNA ligase family protein [Planosporangium thailandense]
MSLVDLAPGQHASRVRDHWWWRPGWRIGRRFYAFHVTFEEQPDLYRLADNYRVGLAAMPALTLIPDQWLHLTMQGIGFTDQVSDATVTAIVDEARDILADVPEFEVEFGEVIVTDEAIVMPAEPAAPVRHLRAAVRGAIGRVFGEDQVPENADRFRPHVSVAYLTADGPAAPYVEALQAAKLEPARVRISHIDLIEMHRDRYMYEWTVLARLPLS